MSHQRGYIRWYTGFAFGALFFSRLSLSSLWAQSSPISEPAPPILNLFSKAEQAIARNDLKLAIDSLQRIVDDPQDSLLARQGGAVPGGVLYESARKAALRMIASLPEDGLVTYRLLYDGKAKRLIERAKADHDDSALRTVLDRFPHTQYGGEAADLLTSWALDEGRPLEVLGVLDLLEGELTNHGWPREQIVARRVSTLVMLDDPTRARSVLKAYCASASEGYPSFFEEMQQALSQTSDGSESLHNELHPLHDAPVMTSIVSTGEGLNPTLATDIPWSYEIPGMADGVWRNRFETGRAVNPAFPSGRSVVSDGTVYVRTGVGCTALDEDDLSIKWEWPPMNSNWAYQSGISGAQDWGALVDPEGTLQFDETVGMLTVADGLVLSLSRQDVEAKLGLAEFNPPSERLSWHQGGHVRDLPPSRLRAIDAATGQERWSVGLSSEAADPFAGITFKAAPLLVKGQVWVPVIRESELLVWVLDGGDGSLVRTISLGGAATDPTLDDIPIVPAYDRNTVYVPSGNGVLYAVSSQDYSVRWAAQYPTRALDDPEAWMSSAPVVRSGTVILAPQDSHKLLAFSAFDGTHRWTSEVPGASYIIESDDHAIEVGGTTVAALSVADGQVIWSNTVDGTPTGRAAVCDEIIFVPVVQGDQEVALLRYSSFDGTPFEPLEGGVDMSPPGNLVCGETALLSVDPESVRSFPDVDRSYRLASRVSAMNRSDPSAALNLAWLELMRGQPESANEVLKAAKPFYRGLSESVGKQIVEQIAHTRVRALIAMAKSVEDLKDVKKDSIHSVRVLELLDEAAKEAIGPEDRLQVAVFKAQQLEQVEKYLESYQTLLTAAFTSDAELMLPSSPHVRLRARTMLAKRLERLAPYLSDQAKGKVVQTVHERLDSARQMLESDEKSRLGCRLLRALAELPTIDLSSSADFLPSGAYRSEALLLLAQWELAYPRFEQAEQYLRRCVQVSDDPAYAVRALVHLFHLYRDPYVELPVAALECLDQLNSLHTDQRVPTKLINGFEKFTDVGADGPDGSDRPDKTDDSEEMLVGDWVAARRSEVIAELASMGIFPDRQERFHLAQEGTVTLAPDAERRESRLLHFLNPSAAACSTRLYLYSEGREFDTVSCLDVNQLDDNALRGRPMWNAELRLPREAITPPASPSSVQQVIIGSGYQRPSSPLSEQVRLAVADGQVAVVYGSGGVFAFGMVTGKRLWAIPYTPSWSRSGRRLDTTLTVKDGYLASKHKQGTLSLHRVIDGSALWERDFPGEQIDHLWMEQDAVVVADPHLERIHLVHREDGSLIAPVFFQQPDLQGRLIDLILDDGMLCGPLREYSDGTGSHEISPLDAVGAFDVTTGELRWRLPLDKPMDRLFRPMRGLVGIGMLGGDVLIVDVQTGEEVLKRRVPQAHAIMDGLLYDGLFLVHHVTTEQESPGSVLTALDVATGDLVWQRDDIPSVHRWDKSLSIERGLMPVVVEVSPENPAQSAPLHLALIDPHTGKDVGPTVELVGTKRSVALNGDWSFWPKAVVIGSTEQLRLFNLVPASVDSTGGF